MNELCKNKHYLNDCVKFRVGEKNTFMSIFPNTYSGIIVGIKFTATMVVYDILDNVENIVYYNIEEKDVNFENVVTN